MRKTGRERKLALQRETVRQLDERLRVVVGGGKSMYTSATCDSSLQTGTCNGDGNNYVPTLRDYSCAC